MSQEEIKEVLNRQLARIKLANDRITELRTICKHPNQHEGLFSYRIGSYHPAIICSDCNQLIQLIDVVKTTTINPK